MFANIAVCTDKIRDNNNNVVKYILIDEAGARYEYTPKKLKQSMLKSEIHVTNLRISKKGYIVGINDVLIRKDYYFLSALELRGDEVLWGFVDNVHGERRGWLPISKISKMVLEKGAAVYGFNTKKIETHNNFTAELANVKVGTPVVFRIGTYEDETQAIFLGTRYDADFEETKYIFFDGVSGQSGRFEIGLSSIYNGRSEYSVEYGIKSTKDIKRVLKDMEVFHLNKVYLNSAMKMLEVYGGWKHQKGKKWAFGK